MAFDFWDDVLKPAWFDVVQCKFSAELHRELCGEFDISLLDSIEKKTMREHFRALKNGNVAYKSSVSSTISNMMQYRRSRPGVEHFIRSLKLASSHNQHVTAILDNIWQQHKDKHPAKEAQSIAWPQEVVRDNLISIATKLAPIPEEVLEEVSGYGVNLDNAQSAMFMSEHSSIISTTAAAQGNLAAMPSLSLRKKVFLTLGIVSSHSANEVFALLNSDALSPYIPESFVTSLLNRAGVGVASLLQVQTALTRTFQEDAGSTELEEAVIAEPHSGKPGADDDLDLMLANATVLMPYGRLIMCGPGRTGKSSLLRSLLRQTFVKDSDSTIGVELEKVMCAIEKVGESVIWKRAENTYQHQLVLTSKAIVHARRRKQIEESIKSRASSKSEHTIRPGQPAPTIKGTVPQVVPPHTTHPSAEQPVRISQEEHADDTDHVTSTLMVTAEPALCSPPLTEQRDFSREIEAAAESINRFLEDLRLGRGETLTKKILSHLIFLDAWDFAGQRVFAAIQHMVLACCRCAYAAVFDASLKFEAIAMPTLGAEGEEYLLENNQKLTNFDILETWLNTIHEVIGNSDDVPVFVIGTHIDKVLKWKQATLKKDLEKYIWDNSRGKAYANSLDQVLFVDNTKAGSRDEDPTVVMLRKLIIQKLQSQFNVQIPVRWLPFTVAIGHIAKEFECPWLPLQELRHVAEACGSVAEADTECDFQEMVKFHHNLGHILHFSGNSYLRDRVIIDVHWLLKVVSLLFCPEPKDRQRKKLRRQYEMLTQEGILLESLAIQRWSDHGHMTQMYTSAEEQRKFLFDIGEHFALFYDTKCRVPVPGRNDGTTTRKFFVPALVTRVIRLQDEVVRGRPTSAILLHSGKDEYFPQTLFWCGVVRCMQEYSPSVDPILYHASARILCRDKYWLVMHYFQHGLRLTVEIPGEGSKGCKEGQQQLDVADDNDVSRLCHEILPYLERQLDDLKEFSLKHVPISRAVRCPCSYNHEKCPKHGKASCADLNCQHYAPIVEGKRTRCQLGGKPEVDITDVQRYWPCFNDDKPPHCPTLEHVSVNGTTGVNKPPGEGSALMNAVQYRSALGKHISLLSTSESFDPVRCANLLRSQGHLTSPVVSALDLLFESQSPDDGRASLVAHVGILPDTAVCYFVEEVLPAMDLGHVSSTIQRCPGAAKCMLTSVAYHKEDNASHSTDRALLTAEPTSSNHDSNASIVGRDAGVEVTANDDPWKHAEYRVHHDWLLSLDMVHFRNKAFHSGLINSEEKETLIATSRSGPQVHNDLLLSYAQTGGEKYFRRLLETLRLMGDRNDEKRLQLSKLLPSCTKDDALMESESRTAADKTDVPAVPSPVCQPQQNLPIVAMTASIPQGSDIEAVSHPDSVTESSDCDTSKLSSPTSCQSQQVTPVPASETEISVPGASNGTSSPVVKTKPADVYRSALKKHSEAFHLCEALDPVQCIKRLHSKQHVPRSTVKDIERSAVNGRHTASIQCVSHVLQMSDAGLCYFVEKYLCAQRLDSLAETVVNCPGDGVCKLDSSDHHHIVSTSTTAMASVATSVEGETSSPCVEQVVSGHLVSQLAAPVETPSSVPPDRSQDQRDGPEKKPPENRLTYSDSATASHYRAALEKHFKILGRCTDFDPVDCARYLRSKSHMSTSVVKKIEEVKSSEGKGEASSRLITYLSELSDAGVCYFVNHYLTGSGLEKISSTIRHCPGPDICTLDAAECHFEADITSNDGIPFSAAPTAGGDSSSPTAAADSVAATVSSSQTNHSGEGGAQSQDISLSSVSSASDGLPSAPAPMASASTAFSSSQTIKSDDGLVLHPATASSSPSKAQVSSIPIASLSKPTADLTLSVPGDADLSESAEDNSDGAMYHRVLRKHVTFFKSFEDLDVVDCMENLRAEDHATDEDVDKVEAIHSSDSGSKKTTMKILYAKLTKLSDEGLRYFVENVLPDLETTEVIQCTFRYCPGPGKCPLKPGQGHKLSSETAAHNVKPMSQHDCSVLLQCYVELKNSINVEDHVLDYLYSKSVISKSLRDRIRHDCSTGDAKAGLLLDELPNCGAGAFQEFVDALDASKTPTHHQLSKKLQGMAKSS